MENMPTAGQTLPGASIPAHIGSVDRSQDYQYEKKVNSRNLQEDPVLQPGDMLVVPKNALSNIKPFLPTTAAGAYCNPAVY